LGYTRINEEMKDPDLVKLIEGIGYNEGLPVVIDPGIIKPKKFIEEVITIRLPNPFMPDAPQRIAMDSSLKIPIRFGETIKAYIASGLKPQTLKLIPLVFAAWLRYLLGVDDNGKAFEVSPDPNYETLKTALNGISLGQANADGFHRQLQPILSNPAYFGVNLYEAGLGERVEEHFAQMLTGTGAVRQLLSTMVG
jgi:fructuronate reductase